MDVLESLVTFPPRNSATGLPIPLSPGNSGKPSVNQLIARKQTMAGNADRDRRNARGWHAVGPTKDACCLIRSQLWRNSVAVKSTVPPDQFLPRNGSYRRPPHGRSEDAPYVRGFGPDQGSRPGICQDAGKPYQRTDAPGRGLRWLSAQQTVSATTGGLCASRCWKFLMLSQVCRAVRP